MRLRDDRRRRLNTPTYSSEENLLFSSAEFVTEIFQRDFRFVAKNVVIFEQAIVEMSSQRDCCRVKSRISLPSLGIKEFFSFLFRQGFLWKVRIAIISLSLVFGAPI